MFLEPYIGQNYQRGINGSKILILGESHYDDEPFDYCEGICDFTPKVVEDIVTNKKHFNFFIKVGRLFSEDWTEVWDKVAFANLIQAVIKTSTQPTQKQIETIVSFYQYLELLKPDKVIVFSSRAWKSWFKKYIDGKPGVECLKEHEIGIKYVFKFPYSNASCKVIGINHPSDRNTRSIELYVQKWKPEIDRFLCNHE